MTQRNTRIETLPSVEEIAFLAGFFDGEGCIVANEHQVYLQVNGTHRGSIERLQRAFGGSVSLRAKQPVAHWKPLWNWRLTAAAPVKQVLIAFLPYLMVKKEQGIEALQWPTHTQTGRDPLPPGMREGRLAVANRLKQLKAEVA